MLEVLFPNPRMRIVLRLLIHISNCIPEKALAKMFNLTQSDVVTTLSGLQWPLSSMVKNIAGICYGTRVKL